ncbi:MAG: ParB/RepB/Spo0J family partition protein [Clostridiaceae bacterium]|nr:ParB/RepB/Spo0J family partition protein [Clostridiaceae bacterium]
MVDKKQPTGPEDHITPKAATPEMPGSAPVPDLTAEEAVILGKESEADLHDPIETPRPIPEAEKPERERPLADLESEKSKPQRGRPLKEEKSVPSALESEKSQEAANLRRGRPSKADKTAPAKAAPPKRDKTSQSRKAAEKTAPVKEAPLSTEPEQPPVPRDATRSEEPEQIVYLNLSELHAFKNHPFGVRDDAEMRSLVESVKAGGVNQPALVRPRADGGYEIIAGHRRQKASELAGYANMPCIVRNMTDDEAVLAMTDDNLRQRTEILPTEKAQSLKMQVEAIKHQGAPAMGETDQKDAGKRSTEVVGERNNMNYKQVQRYIRLTELVPDLQKMVDEKKLSFTPAVEISFIKPKNQRYIAVSIEGQQSSPSLSQAQKLRELDKDGKLNGDVIDGILSQEKKEVDKVIISTTELNKYFGKEKTPQEIKDQIIALLDDWKAKQPPELVKPEKKADLEK